MWQQVLNNMLQVKISQQISAIYFLLYDLFCRFSCYMIFKVRNFLEMGLVCNRPFRQRFYSNANISQKINDGININKEP